MNGVVDFLYDYPNYTVPFVVYIVGLAVVFIASQSFKTFFWNDLLKMGNQLCLVGFGMLVAAGFNRQSQFSIDAGNEIFVTALVYCVVFLLCYLGSLRLCMYAQENPFPGLQQPGYIKWGLAYAGSQFLGMVCIALAWDLP